MVNETHYRKKTLNRAITNLVAAHPKDHDYARIVRHVEEAARLYREALEEERVECLTTD